jgi:FixJ family two-component response regulator
MLSASSQPKPAQVAEMPLVVAIVDDHAALREAIAGLLRSAGYRTEIYASAEHFLKSSAPEGAFRLLILDWRLPGMSGLELQQHLARDGDPTPIVFITALEDPDGQLQAQALRSGAVAFLRKPFNDEVLMSAVRFTCGRPAR